jgi:uncharacterized protein (DUF608 family)
MDIEWPVLTCYEGEYLSQIAFPLGGIGTGMVSLGGRGQLRDWEIMNRPSKGFNPQDTFFAIWVKPEDDLPVTRVLEGVLQPPYEGDFGVGVTAAGLPRFREVRFEAAYPLAQLHLSDPSVPLNIRLKAFNPLIPLDADRSGLPLAVFRFVLSNPTSSPLKVSIAFSIENFIGYDGAEGKAEGGVIEYRDEDGIRGLFLRSEKVPTDAPQWGTIAFVALNGEVSHRHWTTNKAWRSDLLEFWDDFSKDGLLNGHEESGATHASLAASCLLPPQGEGEVTFVLAWHFPNRTARGCGWGLSQGEEIGYVGNYYAQRFKDAWDVLVRTAEELPELERGTVEFVSAFCSSMLPQSVKEAALNNLSTLRTQTCFRTADGRFFGFEGCRPKSGCCFGSCTHVWNYEQATAFLFPELARSMREVEFKFSTAQNGAMAFRTPLPLKRAEGSVRTAADGQMGCIMKLYREWQLSGDEEFLREFWPQAKKALSFAWEPNSWDADGDGVMEGEQHNTYDVEFYGPNPMMQCWYLGALRAAEEMASAVGDAEFAERCRELFERGSRWTDENLFNGEYYEQRIDPEHPDYQFGSGCLVDQLVGQYMAHILGLGHLLKPENVRSALNSIYRYNFKRDLFDHWNVMRTFALNDESALLICTWPKGNRPKRPFPYFSEVMTGFEYQAAVHMIYEGMLAQGLEVIESIRRRYDGRRRNPWNEAECGNHYARAMASWGAILALSGYRYSGVEKEIRFAPKINEDDFNTFWSSANAWGIFKGKITGESLKAELEVISGKIEIRRVKLGWELGGKTPERAEIRCGRNLISAELCVSEGEIVLNFDRTIPLESGQKLVISS